MSEPKGNNYMTLQLSLPALERLFGEMGEEFKIQIQKNVIQQFLKQRVDWLLTDSAKKELEELIRTRIGGGGSYYAKPVLSNDIRQYISDTAAEAVMEVKEALFRETENSIRKAISEYVKSLEERMDRHISRLLDESVKAAVNRIVAAKMQAIVESALKGQASE